MKRVVALLAMLVLLSGTVVPSDAWSRRGEGQGGRHGGGGCCWWMPHVILGGLLLGAVGTVVAAATYPAYAAPQVVYQPYPPAPVYVTPSAPVYAVPASPAYAAPVAQALLVQREVVYPNGRHILYGDGVRQPWQWVWVPAAPVPPPPPPPQQ